VSQLLTALCALGDGKKAETINVCPLAGPQHGGCFFQQRPSRRDGANARAPVHAPCPALEWVRFARSGRTAIVTHIPARISAIYAGPRRYALFTLVGIAVEDDIDASDLNAPTATAASGPNEPMPASDRRLNGGLNQSSSRRQRARDRNTGKRGITAIVHPSPVALDAGASGALRDRIAAELKGIGSSGDAATWAHRVLAAKDTLVTADAEQIEGTFRQKLGILPCPTRPTNTIKFMLVKPARRADTPQIDKSELSYPHSRSRARTVRHQTAMSGLWSHTPRSAPSALCAASGAGSPVNSQCRSAAVIIARSFAAAMRRHGSRRSA
jgi:hypothetical protein